LTGTCGSSGGIAYERRGDGVLKLLGQELFDDTFSGRMNIGPSHPCFGGGSGQVTDECLVIGCGSFGRNPRRRPADEFCRLASISHGSLEPHPGLSIMLRCCS
jgi:hypothetical protein